MECNFNLEIDDDEKMKLFQKTETCKPMLTYVGFESEKWFNIIAFSEKIVFGLCSLSSLVHTETSNST